MSKDVNNHLKQGLCKNVNHNLRNNIKSNKYVFNPTAGEKQIHIREKTAKKIVCSL